VTSTRRRWAAVGLVPAAAVLWTSLPLAVAVGQDAPLRFDDAATAATLPQLGGRGAYALRYEHGDHATLTVAVTNEGMLPLRVVGARLTDEVRPLLETVAVSAGAGDGGGATSVAPGETAEVAVTVRHDNCEFYTERAMSVFPGLELDVEVLGRRTTRQVRFDHDLVVRSPTMVTCPDRVRDRDANQRRDHAG
jgi:hypothetical protein